MWPLPTSLGPSRALTPKREDDVVKKMGPRDKLPGFIWALLLLSPRTLDKLFNLSVPQFLHLYYRFYEAGLMTTLHKGRFEA